MTVFCVADLTFQSTLSMRRATRVSAINPRREAISIHALHEESDSLALYEANAVAISIHALHEESDPHKSVCRA